MKKLLLLITCILTGMASFGQQIDLNKQVLITPSSKLVRLSKDEIVAFESEKFHDNKHDRMKSSGAIPTFKVDDILITLNSEKTTLEPNHLINLKKGFDAMSAKNISYSSYMETVNNQQVLVMSAFSGNTNTKHYQFVCINKANTTAFVGFIEFKPSDEAEAKHVLDDLIKHITFKD
ncbi:hypothetical protein [Mucilaginibacter sp. UR6-11]|uniref:hypothetical protein n=1 Tax=Mucilaginibacter sp. UR6-11 TaxID=1435644 RepID=UPI001E5C359F|nr:hypothetical protein [Mucilaginibacter sp. UR6-11]MCC8427316.1 hypothetical protein [Mucilaginibacter sp. UR6-11]